MIPYNGDPVVFNESKHSPIQVVRSVRHPYNLVRIEVVHFDPMNPTEKEGKDFVYG